MSSSVAVSSSNVSASVSSEAGPLRQVTPNACDELLFDEVLWPRRAREEHRAFVAILQDRGADVVHLTDRLEHLAKVLTGQRLLVESIVGDAQIPPRAEQWLRAPPRGWLNELSAPELVRTAIAGCVKTEVSAPRDGQWWWSSDDEHSVVAALANQMFVRDSSFKVGRRPVLVRMREPARRRETALLGVLYEHEHEHLADTEPAAPGLGLQLTPEGVALEGGDVAVLSDRIIAVGVSTRTSPSAVVALVDQFGSEFTVIVIELLRRWATMHLDTVMTVLDADTIQANRGVAEAPVTLVRAGSRHVSSDQCANLTDALRRTSSGPKKVIHPPQDDGAAREQWDYGGNVPRSSSRCCGRLREQREHKPPSRRIRDQGARHR